MMILLRFILLLLFELLMVSLQYQLLLLDSKRRVSLSIRAFVTDCSTVVASFRLNVRLSLSFEPPGECTSASHNVVLAPSIGQKVNMLEQMQRMEGGGEGRTERQHRKNLTNTDGVSAALPSPPWMISKLCLCSFGTSWKLTPRGTRFLPELQMLHCGSLFCISGEMRGALFRCLKPLTWCWSLRFHQLRKKFTAACSAMRAANCWTCSARVYIPTRCRPTACSDWARMYRTAAQRLIEVNRARTRPAFPP